ncbi:hypothetical protein [Streptomyces sp. NPDC020965]|uniref:hypothetical protein n=1 Tax=Streptomyces sp. NPDC020965 TaxID=3365105 RepID=UPI00378C7778
MNEAPFGNTIPVRRAQAFGGNFSEERGGAAAYVSAPNARNANVQRLFVSHLRPSGGRIFGQATAHT